MGSSSKVKIAKFGVFEADFERNLLVKNGLRVKLQDQPFQLLGLLLARPGEIITRDEIQQALWPAGTFVEFDDGLNTAIKKLRAALGDSADNPRFVETVPRRGYRFIAPVVQPRATTEAISPVADPETSKVVASSTPTIKSHRAKTWVALCCVGLVLVCAAAAVWLMRRPKPGLKETDSVLLADLTNSTSEPVFDNALREAAAVELGQSPFLSIVSNDRVRETLRAMSQPPDDRVSAALAREVCERTGAKVYLTGSLSRRGMGYLLALRAVNCTDETVFAREEAEPGNKDGVLPALDEVAAKMRRRLGESLSSIRQFDVPVEEATTPSLEALKAYSLGNVQRAHGEEKQSLPFFEHALELDPNFAMAHLARANALSNLGETERADDEIRKAYALRANLSEREKLLLTVRYADADKADTRKVIATYQVWHRLYPRDARPVSGLAARYQIIGEYEKALEASREAMELRPDYYVSYGNLARTYEALNRFEEAKQVCAKAEAAHLDSTHTHSAAFEIAYLQKDPAGMAHEIAFVKGTNHEQSAYWDQGLILALAGKLRQARPLLEQSYQKRREDELDDFAAYAMATEALIEADFGFIEQARSRARRAMRIGRGIDAEESVAEVLGLTGAEQEAVALTQDLRTRFPMHVPLNPGSIPVILAGLQLHKGNPAKAVQLLQEAIPYDLAEFTDLAPLYIRGLAYLRLGDGPEAAAQFQKYLDHPGINSIFPRRSLSVLGLARAYALMHDTARARKTYEEFLGLWSEADPDIPIYREAQTEYRKLQPSKP